MFRKKKKSCKEGLFVFVFFYNKITFLTFDFQNLKNDFWVHFGLCTMIVL